MSAYEIVVSGMQSDTARIEMASRNIANANTAAYKKEVSFSQFIETPSSSPAVEHSSQRDFSSSVSEFTSQSMDLALAGPGFFVLDEGGSTVLSRSGNFTVDEQGFLSSKSGGRVQAESGDVFIGDQKFLVTRDGTMIIGGEIDGQLKLVLPDHPEALVALGGGRYALATEITTDVPHTERVVYQYRLETSNVDLKTEMVEMTKTLKHFEAQQRLLKAYDSVLDMGISELGNFD